MPNALISPEELPPANLFDDRDLAAQREFFARRPHLAATPLRDCSALARHLGVGQLLIKDETARFGLNAFKGAGALFAVTTLQERGEIRAGGTITCASEGNHGRAVARAARDAGCAARVYMSNRVSRARVEAIEGEGADVVLVNGTYDEAVRTMARDADAHGWIVVSDTSWAGYTEIPRLIMLGYTRIMDEIDGEPRLKPGPAARGGAGPQSASVGGSRRQPGADSGARVQPGADSETRVQPGADSGAGLQPGQRIDAIFVPAGVGGLLTAVACWCDLRYGRARPRIVAVEPLSATCVQASMRAGSPTAVPGPFDTVLGGLRCGEISPAVFPAVRSLVDACVGIEDDFAFQAMRLMARPAAPDPAIECGPSGAAALGGLLATLVHASLADLKRTLGLGAESRVLVLATEGVTDPAAFREVLARH